MVDKVEAKNFITEKIGGEHVIPTLGLWNSYEDIDFGSLPNKFILKCTHDSGSYFICKDKETLDHATVRKKLLINYTSDYYLVAREWPYKGLKRRIIAEPLLKDEAGGAFLADYKFYCFNGIPKVLYITSNRGSASGLNEDFFDVDGRHLGVCQKGYYNSAVMPKLPHNMDAMIEYCKILSMDTYQLRVDFYETDPSHFYCGELTFFDGGGFCEFVPAKYDRIFGDWIKLPID